LYVQKIDKNIGKAYYLILLRLQVDNASLQIIQGARLGICDKGWSSLG